MEREMSIKSLNSHRSTKSKKSTKQIATIQDEGFKTHRPTLNLPVNEVFRDLFEKRKSNYFENKLNSDQSSTPISYFLLNHCNSSISRLVYFNRIKVNSEERFFVFITKDSFILSKDYEDLTNVNFYSEKNPVIIKTGLLYIEKVVLSIEEKGKKLIQLVLSPEAQIHNNLM